MSSNQSMRGTVFYVAPECGGDASEKCDVYSFGVLLLVIVSGRRPLEVTTGSPLSSSEFQRANLVSWGRHCSRKGKLLDLVDESIQGLDKEQALLCIKVALLCLLKSTSRRPFFLDGNPGQQTSPGPEQRSMPPNRPVIQACISLLPR
ncbi:Receptor-like serine/threonine-protein kinase [Arachis hypogaea]|uniref:Protein kinase domain-containing protein n=1 Tax=Arachis hypogaea TaxID=3818 RepID=A0A445BFU7_ARAHY|nr:Receptor-like serine/threonine-protein kinase [Arachis hypogaea]RYR37553.1 hypothetical protein Ahy_A09g042436 [Arachis hypogaea]